MKRIIPLIACFLFLSVIGILSNLFVINQNGGKMPVSRGWYEYCVTDSDGKKADIPPVILVMVDHSGNPISTSSSLIPAIDVGYGMGDKRSVIDANSKYVFLADVIRFRGYISIGDILICAGIGLSSITVLVYLIRRSGLV
jgi:hypothetical protein